MSYAPTQAWGIGTAVTGRAALDWLTIRCNGAANPTSIEGTLKNWVLSVTYSSNQWLVKFKPDFGFKLGTMFGAGTVQDTLGTFVVANLGYNPATQTLTLGFATGAAATTPAPPPAAGTYNAVNVTAHIMY